MKPPYVAILCAGNTDLGTVPQVVVGTGGAAALWLTARRQRATEVTLKLAKGAPAPAREQGVDPWIHRLP